VIFRNGPGRRRVILISRRLEGGAAMTRVFHRDLMRGRVVQNAAIALFLGLLLILTASVWHGIGSLAS
jgi:hypothetical protein